MFWDWLHYGTINFAFVMIHCIDVEQENASLKAIVQDLRGKTENKRKSENYVELVPSSSSSSLSDKSISCYTCDQVTIVTDLSIVHEK